MTSTCGIYKLLFKNDNSFYIGCSIHIPKRVNDHLSALRRNTHKNYKLQEKFNLFGEPECIILEECSKEQIYDREFSWIKNTNAINSLNISIGGRGTLPGELHSQSKTTNIQAILIVEYLVYTNKTHKDIAKLVGVGIDTVNNISKGATHTWIYDEYPELYTSLKALKGTKNGIHLTAEARGIILPKIISPDNTVYEVTNIREFSREHCLDYSGLNKVLHGKQKTTKGWKIYAGT